MARTNPETRLTNRIRKRLMKTFDNCVFYKIHGNEYMESGIPDLLGCIEGLFVAIEVKHPDTDHGVSKFQQVQMDRLSTAGALVLVAEDPDEVVRDIRHILRMDVDLPESQAIPRA